ncbi:hypothetical protein BB561_002508 [Smittium simulii]|uniref:Uncharacterized protein n=1 Tax=Smittium simulii TaxID=133385 RepID=A0A2T9YQ91_9FUNG|nr:hypothetical protein BB561_002508 [Smittium simulii]
MQQYMQEIFFEVINDLAEKVKFLYIEREQQGTQQAQVMGAQNIECDGPHIIFRAPIVQKLTSLGAQYLRKKKEFIYECPKFLGMNITLPPLNEEATSAVQKNDATLYGIQMALANMTKPIYDLKLNSPNTRIQDKENLEFAHLMKELLSDVASSITQSKIDNLHKLVGILDRENKSLFFAASGQDSQTTNRSGAFWKRVSKSLATATLRTAAYYLFALLQVEDKQESYQHNYQEGRGSFSKEKNYTGKEYNTRFLQLTLYHTKENKRPKSSSGRQEAQQLRRTEKFQDGITDIHMQDYQEKRLHCVFRSRRRFYACSDTLEMQKISLLSME